MGPAGASATLVEGVPARTNAHSRSEMTGAQCMRGITSPPCGLRGPISQFRFQARPSPDTAVVHFGGHHNRDHFGWWEASHSRMLQDHSESATRDIICPATNNCATISGRRTSPSATGDWFENDLNVAHVLDIAHAHSFVRSATESLPDRRRAPKASSRARNHRL
jgi:hypothetical protein